MMTQLISLIIENITWSVTIIRSDLIDRFLIQMAIEQRWTNQART